MCLLGQVSDARLGCSQGCASGLDLAAGCHCGSDLHVVLGILFSGVIAWPLSHSLNNVRKTLNAFRGVGGVEALSLSSIHFLLATASHLAKPHVPGQKRLLHTDCSITALWGSEKRRSGDLTLAVPSTRMDAILLPGTL